MRSDLASKSPRSMPALSEMGWSTSWFTSETLEACDGGVAGHSSPASLILAVFLGS